MTNPNTSEKPQDDLSEEGIQIELFPGSDLYDVTEDVSFFENVDMSALGEALESRDAKLTSYLKERLEKAGGKDIGLESLLRRAEKGTLSLEIEFMKMKRNNPKL